MFFCNFITFFGPNWIDTGLFRHVSDRVDLYPDISESKKKKIAMDARATVSTAAQCSYACWRPSVCGSIPFIKPPPARAGGYPLLIDHLAK